MGVASSTPAVLSAAVSGGKGRPEALSHSCSSIIPVPMYTGPGTRLQWVVAVTRSTFVTCSFPTTFGGIVPALDPYSSQPSFFLSHDSTTLGPFCPRQYLISPSLPERRKTLPFLRLHVSGPPMKPPPDFGLF